MAYGIYLYSTNTNKSYFDDPLVFYPTTRSGISSSDLYRFLTFNFNSQKMKVGFNEFGNLISSVSNNNFSYINFDLNVDGFYGVANNMSKPAVVELCEICGYETGVGKTVLSGSGLIGQKTIQNFSNPTSIYSIGTSGFNVSYFSNALSYVSNENFGYVHYNDNLNNISKYFLASPSSVWYELPDQTFYYSSDFYLQISSGINFSGASLALNLFNQIIPTVGQQIVINNVNNNDKLSGLYTIIKITNQVYLSPALISYNFPGQIFSININLNTSTLNSLLSDCFYIPYEYGTPSKTFSKNLQLKQYLKLINTTSAYFPLFKDAHSNSSLILCLTKQGQLTKQSDVFQLGIAVSNWFPDSLLFGVNLNYSI